MIPQTAPLNTWLGAGTSIFAPYPCRCGARRAGRSCDPTWCPCAGRTDLGHVPAGCCAHWATPVIAAAAQRAYSASRR